MTRRSPASQNEAAKIAAAIATAQTYMLAGDPPYAAIHDAAEEAGLIPALLDRRFVLACGEPAAWLAKVRAAIPVTDAINASARERAMALAKAKGATLSLSRDDTRDIGKIFTWNGEEYAFVRVISGVRTWAIHAVAVVDGASHKFNSDARCGIYAQVRPANSQFAMYETAEAYRQAFGQEPAVWQFMGPPLVMGRQAVLMRVLRAAIAQGQPVTEADLYVALGITPPPADTGLEGGTDHIL